MFRKFPLQRMVYSLCIFFVSFETTSIAAKFESPKACGYSENYYSLPISMGRFIQATVRMPKCIKQQGRLPVFMIFGGFESAAHVLDLVHPHQPVVLASFDYPFSVSRKLRFRDVFEIIKQSKTLFLDTVAGIESLTDLLKQLPEIDSKNIIGIGASFGSPVVLAAAAHHPDIRRIILIHAFGQVQETANHVILRSWLTRYGWISRPLAWAISHLVIFHLGLELPEISASNLKPEQKVLMITAQEDSFIPRASSDSLWKAIESSRAKGTRILMPGDHLMPGAELLISKIVQIIENWMD